MKVEIVYGDGKIGVFDTANLVAGQPFGRSCITAELVMRFDMADSEGVCLDIHHHDIAEEADDADVPFANRCRGYRVCLAEAGELDGIESIVVDDRVVAWRQAGRSSTASASSGRSGSGIRTPPTRGTTTRHAASTTTSKRPAPTFAATPRRSALCSGIRWRRSWRRGRRRTPSPRKTRRCSHVQMRARILPMAFQSRVQVVYVRFMWPLFGIIPATANSLRAR